MRVPLFDLRYFEYHHLIRYYRELVGPERLLVLAYEQLATDPYAFAAQIGRFAGVSVPEKLFASKPGMSRRLQPRRPGAGR